MAIGRRLSATRVRQGRMGVSMFWVLAISTALATIALFAAWSWRANDLRATETSPDRAAAAAEHFNMGDPVAQQTAPEPPAR